MPNQSPLATTISHGQQKNPLADRNETGNAYTITITDTSVDAAALNTLDGKTTVAINAANINTLTGAAADPNTAYDSDGITGLDDEDITLSDTIPRRRNSSTPLTATPQAPSMPAPSTPSPVLPQTCRLRLGGMIGLA